jgi:TPR repeat protein
MNQLRFFLTPIALVFVASALSGCISLVIGGADYASDRVKYSRNIEAATDGGAEAQTAIGDALCCSPESIDWYCRAADQGESAAMFRLGQVYSGDAADGVGVFRLVGTLLDDDEIDRAQAYYWFKRAAELRHPDGLDAASNLDLDSTERAEAEAYLSGRAETGCGRVSDVDG